MASNRTQFNKKFKISKLNMKSLDLLRFFISVLKFNGGTIEPNLVRN